MNNEVYVSTDVETDGPIPGIYSILNLAEGQPSAKSRRLPEQVREGISMSTVLC